MIFALTTVFAILANVGVVTATPGVLTPLDAPSGINFVVQGSNKVAWIDGQNACNNVIVGPVGANPCGRSFNINGQTGFTFENYGGNGFFINQNGKLFATCGPLSEPDEQGCNGGSKPLVHSYFHCI